MSSVRSQALWIFIAGLLLFVVGQGTQIIGFESRFYLFALEMWRHGLTFFPTSYGMPYPDYPVTSTFLIYLVAKLLNGVTRFAAIFPTAVASALTFSVTYLLGALYRKVWGLAAVLFLAMTYAFITEARSISLDQFTTAVTVLCVYLIISANVLKRPQRIGWVLPLFVVGFAFRGPLGLVIPTGVVCVLLWLSGEIKKGIIIGLLSALLLAVCGGLLLGLAQLQGGEGFLQDVIHKEVLGRLQTGSKNPPTFFYFKESLGAYALTYPLAILVLLGHIFNFKYSPSTRFLKMLFAWSLVVLIGLSIPVDKKIRYILPAAPAFALICGYLFVVTRDRKYLYSLKKLFLYLCYFFPLGGLIATYLLHHAHPEIPMDHVVAISLLSFLSLNMLLMYRRELFAFGIAVLSLFVIQICVIEPINVELMQVNTMVEKIESIRQEKKADLGFYHLGHDGLVIKYMANMQKEVSPLFVKQDSDLKKLKKNIIIMTSAKHYQNLPKKIAKRFSVILKGQLAREEIVVFQKQ